MTAIFPPTKARSRHPGIYIIFYCASTISLLFFNKWIFTQIPEFRFVLTITWIQQLGVALIILLLHPLLKFVIGNVSMSVILFKRIAPVGIIAAIDYAFSNLALQALPMTIYEIVKSCAPAIVLMLSIGLGLTKPSVKLTIVVAAIVSGAIIGVYRPGGGHGPDVSTIGLFYIVMAALCAASKSVAAQITLQGDKSKLPKGTRRATRVRAILKATPLTPNLSEPSMMSHTPRASQLDAASPSVTRGSMGADAAEELPSGASDPSRRDDTLSNVGPADHHRLPSYGAVSDDAGSRAGDTLRGSTLTDRKGSFNSTDGDSSGMGAHDAELYDRYGPINPATVAFVCSVVTVLMVLPSAMAREHAGLAGWVDGTSWEAKVGHVSLVLMGSTLSVVANICSFFVMRETSALTYALVAVCQRGLTVVAAVLFLDESMPPMAIGGFSLTMCGIIYYNRMSLNAHHHHRHADEHSPAKGAHGEGSQLVSSGSSVSVPVSTRRSHALSDRPRRHRLTSKLQYSMATTCGDSLYLPALESHSDSSSSSSSDDDAEIALRHHAAYFL